MESIYYILSRPSMSMKVPIFNNFHEIILFVQHLYYQSNICDLYICDPCNTDKRDKMPHFYYSGQFYFFQPFFFLFSQVSEDCPQLLNYIFCHNFSSFRPNRMKITMDAIWTYLVQAQSLKLIHFIGICGQHSEILLNRDQSTIPVFFSSFFLLSLQKCYVYSIRYTFFDNYCVTFLLKNGQLCFKNESYRK